jgi:hypothetical protein
MLRYYLSVCSYCCLHGIDQLLLLLYKKNAGIRQYVICTGDAIWVTSDSLRIKNLWDCGWAQLVS